MLNRTTPQRLTLIVLALLVGILLGLALLPSGNLSGAAQSGICDSVIEIPTAECQALEALYESSNGAGWTTKTDWLTTNTPCSWYGVSCLTGHVWQIDLTANNLVGPLPSTIGDLSNLQVLLLGSNQLSGGIPRQLGNLTNLSRLNLSSNQFRNAIPSALGNLTQLRELSLAYNSLTGEIPIQLGNMTNLQTMELVSNTLAGPIPSEFGDLIKLEWLDLAGNMLTGTIPAELGLPTDLSTLYVDGNQLEGEVPDSLCTNLNLTTLGYNKLDPLTSDSCLDSVISDEWKATQTLPPANLVANSYVPGEIQLDWTIVTEMVDLGYYEVLYATTSGGPYEVHGQTADKTTSSYNIADLDLSNDFFFVVRTVTPSHENNQNELVSANSSEAPSEPNAISLTDFQANQPLPLLSLSILAALMLLSAGAFLYLRRNA